MATQTLGHTTVLKVDEDGDSMAHTTIANVRSITPPTLTRDAVDETVLASTIMEWAPGDPEDMGQLQFVLFWEPNDTNHEFVDTLFQGKNEYEWQIVYPTSPNVTDEFTGWVEEMSPETIESKEVISRSVTVRLTSAITRT